jgi:hypothetical protein
MNTSTTVTPVKNSSEIPYIANPIDTFGVSLRRDHNFYNTKGVIELYNLIQGGFSWEKGDEIPVQIMNALNYFDAAIQLNKLTLKPYINQALVKMYSGYPASAASAISPALLIEPSSPRVRFLYACAAKGCSDLSAIATFIEELPQHRAEIEEVLACLQEIFDASVDPDREIDSISVLLKKLVTERMFLSEEESLFALLSSDSKIA